MGGYWISIAVLVALCFVLHRAGLVRFRLPGPGWLVVALVLITGGWMAYDGMHAFLAGDYVTPESMPGELGPWRHAVEAVGIEPRSQLMRSLFVAYGLAYVGVAFAFAAGASWGRKALLIVAALGLWYLPFGTLFNLIAIGLLCTRRLRTRD